MRSDTHDDPTLHPHHGAVRRAIELLVRRRDDAPSLDEVAAVAKMSPEHFQRVFKRWAGVSPKRFSQALTLDHAKRLLADDASVLAASVDAGLSAPSRVHDLFVACEAVTPGEFKRRGEGVTVRWDVHDSPLGDCLLATTSRGVCWLGFGEGDALIDEFASDWPAATRVRDGDATHALAAQLFEGGDRAPVRLDLHGTSFQLQVWRALLRIPEGRVASYQQVAAAVGRPTAVRAVGSAIGRNPVSWLIPCHRVILSTGVAHAYRWGVDRKQTLLAVEAARAAAA